MNSSTLRRLLERSGSYPAIETASASGELSDLLPVSLFEHIGIIYRRLEDMAGPNFREVASLRLAVLLHEEPPRSLPGLLATARLDDLAPTVVGVLAGFGAVWKAADDRQMADYVEAHREHLAALLLFEVAHEGRVTLGMARAAALGGLERWLEQLESWGTSRLAAGGPLNALSKTTQRRARRLCPSQLAGSWRLPRA